MQVHTVVVYLILRASFTVKKIVDATGVQASSSGALIPIVVNLSEKFSETTGLTTGDGLGRRQRPRVREYQRQKSSYVLWRQARSEDGYPAGDRYKGPQRWVDVPRDDQGGFNRFQIWGLSPIGFEVLCQDPERVIWRAYGECRIMSAERNARVSIIICSKVSFSFEWTATSSSTARSWSRTRWFSATFRRSWR